MSLDAALGIILAASLFGWVATRYSVFCLPVVVALCILAEDEFYPLSHFPMYSDPDESENYFYLVTFRKRNDEMRPLPVRRLTGLSAPKVKKMWKPYSRDFADELGKKDTELTLEERAEIGRVILDEMREMAVGRGRPLPDRLGLVEVWIESDEEKGWTETTTVVARQPFEETKTP